MRFWLDKGVDGFRMDVIPLISKQPGLPDLRPDQMKTFVTLWANGPHRDEYLQEMNKQALSPYDTMTVGEAIGISLAQEPQIIDDKRHELNLVFNFDAIRINRGAGYTERKWQLPELKAIYDEHASVLGKTDWDTVFLSNHDNPRMLSNFGDDSPEYRVPSAKLLETMILTLRGTPFLYEGDELGMTNYPFTKLSQFDDIEVKNAYRAKVLTGKMSEEQFVAEAHRFGRDNSRTPMQWDTSSNGGFTSAEKPWLAVNPNYKEINASAELADPNSVYHYTQQLVKFHRSHPALVYGDYKDLDPANLQVYAYTRSLGTERYLVVLNFSHDAVSYSLPDGIKAGELVLGNLPVSEHDVSNLQLRPWESRIYRY